MEKVNEIGTRRSYGIQLTGESKGVVAEKAAIGFPCRKSRKDLSHQCQECQINRFRDTNLPDRDLAAQVRLAVYLLCCATPCQRHT